MPVTCTPKASIAHENIKENLGFWARYEWPARGDEWSAALGGTRAMWDCIIRPRISRLLPARSILEIAPGHGRCTQFLLDQCKELTIVDLVPECIAACRQRFGERDGLTYAVNDGATLPMVPDASIDLAFTWDSLVHVEGDVVRSYVRELARVLAPGGHAFIHHSNLGAYADRHAEFDRFKDFHGRAAGMSAAIMRDECQANSLHCVSQELIPWGSTGLFIDAISFLCKAPAGPTSATLVEEHKGWRIETETSRHIDRLFGRTLDGPSTPSSKPS